MLHLLYKMQLLHKMHRKLQMQPIPRLFLRILQRISIRTCNRASTDKPDPPTRAVLLGLVRGLIFRTVFQDDPGNIEKEDAL